MDEEAWLRQNNRSFADHPEQGGWTAATLAQHEAEPWFDPDGFLLHERGGRLAGSCWTKLHPATETDAELGEIYVIGVDPDFHGKGLGPQLTLAGLAWIADRGVTTGMLFVDAANTPALHMYEKLGFTPRREDRAYVRAPAARGPTSAARSAVHLGAERLTRETDRAQIERRDGSTRAGFDLGARRLRAETLRAQMAPGLRFARPDPCCQRLATRLSSRRFLHRGRG